MIKLNLIFLQSSSYLCPWSQKKRGRPQVGRDSTTSISTRSLQISEFLRWDSKFRWVKCAAESDTLSTGSKRTTEAESERRANGENRGMRATHGRLRLALTQPTDLYIPPSTNCSFLTWFDFRLVSRFGVNILLDFLFSVTGLVNFVFTNGSCPT